ncbi:ExbD/TolR family protein [Verrucomicrobiota bacterium]
MAKRAQLEGCETDMTPMIDVVFQLIIFFIVTIKLDQEINTDIKLEKAPYGPAIEGHQDPFTTEIEVDKRGWITMHNAKISKSALRSMLIAKYRRIGRVFPILIRADARTKHKDVKTVMDICTDAGMWRINFAAIKVKKTK